MQYLLLIETRLFVMFHMVLWNYDITVKQKYRKYSFCIVNCCIFMRFLTVSVVKYVTNGTSQDLENAAGKQSCCETVKVII